MSVSSSTGSSSSGSLSVRLQPVLELRGERVEPSLLRGPDPGPRGHERRDAGHPLRVRAQEEQGVARGPRVRRGHPRRRPRTCPRSTCSGSTSTLPPWPWTRGFVEFLAAALRSRGILARTACGRGRGARSALGRRGLPHRASGPARAGVPDRPGRRGPRPLELHDDPRVPARLLQGRPAFRGRLPPRLPPPRGARLGRPARPALRGPRGGRGGRGAVETSRPSGVSASLSSRGICWPDPFPWPRPWPPPFSAATPGDSRWILST